MLKAERSSIDTAPDPFGAISSSSSGRRAAACAAAEAATPSLTTRVTDVPRFAMKSSRFRKSSSIQLRLSAMRCVELQVGHVTMTVPLAYACRLMLCELGPSQTLHVKRISKRSRFDFAFCCGTFDEPWMMAAACCGSSASTSASEYPSSTRRWRMRCVIMNCTEAESPPTAAATDRASASISAASSSAASSSSPPADLMTAASAGRLRCQRPPAAAAGCARWLDGVNALTPMTLIIATLMRRHLDALEAMEADGRHVVGAAMSI